MSRKNFSSACKLLLYSALVLASCKKQDINAPLTQQNDAKNNSSQIQVVEDGSYHAEIVPATLAKLVVQTDAFLARFNGMDSIKMARLNKPVKKTVGQIITLQDNRNNAALHVVNYQEGGWVILSAERQSLPVLAYSETGEFDVNNKEGIEVGGWINSSKKMVERIRSKKTLSSKEEIKSVEEPSFKWNHLFTLSKLKVRTSGQTATNETASPLIGDGDGPDPDPNPCNSGNDVLVHQAGPLLQTKWKQTGGAVDYPFNYYIPNKATAGCSPVAIGQVMKYWQFPSSMYWAGVATGTVSTGWTAWLLWDIGVRAGTAYGSYAGAPSTTSDQGMVNALKSYGYSYVSLKYGFEPLTVISWLPVILNGKNSSTGISHSWVCDGYQEWVNYSCGNGGVRYFDMNWGHAGKNDGYFTYLGEYATNPRMILVRP